MEIPNRRLGSAEIAGLLRREIASGKLAAKDRLPPERYLSENYRVARGTVREALNLLASEGLLEVRPGSGTYVTEGMEKGINPAIQNASPLELIDSRFALEPHICRLAVLHAGQQDLVRAESLIEKMENSVEEPITFSELDTTFHHLLAEITGNTLLLWMISQINSVRNQSQWARMRQLTLNPEIIQRYNRQHREIIEAIRSREPERAASLMKGHLESARLSLTRAAST